MKTSKPRVLQQSLKRAKLCVSWVGMWECPRQESMSKSLPLTLRNKAQADLTNQPGDGGSYPPPPPPSLCSLFLPERSSSLFFPCFCALAPFFLQAGFLCSLFSVQIGAAPLLLNVSGHVSAHHQLTAFSMDLKSMFRRKGSGDPGCRRSWDSQHHLVSFGDQGGSLCRHQGWWMVRVRRRRSMYPTALEWNAKQAAIQEKKCRAGGV